MPGTGLSLPRAAGVMRPGMSERSARWAVATLADVRETWVCGARWAFTARYAGLALFAYGDCRDRTGSGGDRPGLAAVAVSRDRDDLTGPAAVPVVLDGIDLFGYPAAEVVEIFGRRPYPDVVLEAAEPDGYVRKVEICADR